VPSDKSCGRELTTTTAGIICSLDFAKGCNEAGMLDSAIKTGEVLRPIPAWKVLLLALLVAIGIAAGFLAVFAAADRPVSPAEFQADPLMGQKIADRDNGIVLMHALVQLAFAVLGSWYVKFRSGNRILFLAIVIPIGAIVFLITVVGLIAK